MHLYTSTLDSSIILQPMLCAVNKSAETAEALPATSFFLLPPWRCREYLRAVCYQDGIIMWLVLLKSSSSSIVVRVL